MIFVLVQAFTKKIEKNLLLFVFLISISFVVTYLINQRLSATYKNLIFLYLVQPLAIIMFMRGSTINISIFNGFFVLKLISWSAIPLSAGCLYFYCVHLLGFGDPFDVFYVEFTEAGSEIVLRNPSFMGSSLLLCGVALIQFLASQYLYLTTNKYFYQFFSMLALTSVLLSLSRRAILPILVYYIILGILYPKKHGVNLVIFGTTVVVLASVFVPGIFSVLMARIVSIFDVVNDSSNASRLALMQEGISDIILKPWGLGFGTLSSVGYTQEEVWKLGEARVTESTLITLFGEIGLILMSILTALLVKYLSVLKYSTVMLFVLPIVVGVLLG